VAVISCNKDDATEIIPELQLMDVVFDINNFLPQDGSKNLFSSKENGENDPLIPDCSGLEPSYVIININDEDYTLQLVTLNDNTETEVIKLLAGDYVINSFIVYAADDTPIWASPFMDSYYQTLWSLKGVNELPFTVEEFNKVKIELDVLCYRPFDYEKFGFAWFAYSRIEIHTVCFFGDICTKFYEEFHREGSPYYSQDFDGYDFSAIFEIVVRDALGNIVNDSNLNSNLEWQGVGSPLCIEYPDQVGVAETFTFEIMLAMPSGAWELVYTGEFDETAMSTAGEEGFGGIDGVFDFVVGNCSYDGNDANVELPAYLPIPISGKMTLLNYPNEDAYVDITFNEIVGPTIEIFDGATLGGWCASEHDNIGLNTYSIDFYSSLEPLTLPVIYQDIEWGALNWIMNNLTGTSGEIQEAIWQVVNSTDTDTVGNPEAGNPATSALAIEALNNIGFIPTVGDYAIVICDAIEGLDSNEDLQLMIVKVDP